jgi:hypothetical protein
MVAKLAGSLAESESQLCGIKSERAEELQGYL